MTSTSETKRSAVVREGNVHIKKKKDTARSAFHDTSKMSLIQRDDSYIVPVRLFLFLQHDQQKESSSCPGWLLAFHRRYHYWCNTMIIRFRKSVSAKKIEFFFFSYFLRQTTLNIYFMVKKSHDSSDSEWWGLKWWWASFPLIRTPSFVFFRRSSVIDCHFLLGKSRYVKPKFSTISPKSSHFLPTE